MSFIEENCIVFDNDDENKLEYTVLHNVKYFTIKLNIEFQKDCWWLVMWSPCWTGYNLRIIYGCIWKSTKQSRT